MAQLIQAGEFVGPGERKTAAALEKELPPRWKVICNKLFVAPSGASREIDFIVIADHCVFVIDEKHWWGPIIGNENGWTLSDGSSRPSPITNVEMVARPVVGVLRNKIARLDDRVRGKFVHARIILSAENSSLSLDDPRAKAQVLPLAEAAARLIADDRGHPPSASIEHFRNAIIDQLTALRDRPRIPQKINDYEIVESLPPVAGSKSFRGVHPDGGERVLRVIELTASEISELQQRAETVHLREYNALRQLADTGRAPKVDPYFSWSDGAYLVVPTHLPEGETLRSVALTAGRPGQSDALSVAAEAFAALAEVHMTGTIHRGINQDTVHLAEGGRISFSNFGFARLEGSPTVAEGLDGSSAEDAFRAPEIRLGLGFAVPESDVYALAATLVAWITGIEPDVDEPWTEIDGPFSELATACGDELGVELIQSLREDERDRPSAGSVAHALAAMQGEASADDLRMAKGTDRELPEPERFIEGPAAPAGNGNTGSGVSRSEELMADAIRPAPAAPVVDKDGRRFVNDRYSFLLSNRRPGGFADVYLGVDTDRPGERVAIKLLRRSADGERLLQLLYDREVRALKELEHPNIVRLLDAGTDLSTGEHFLVLEWVPSDLESRLKERGVYEGWEDYFEAIGQPVLSALAYAHERQVVHRDVKPANVLIQSDDTPKLADFGISRIKFTLATQGATVADFASRPYAPPELDAGARYDRDVFGFGVLTLRALCDVPVLDYPDIKVALEDLDAPPGIEDLIQACVAFEPAARPRNAVELKTRLEAVHSRWQARPATAVEVLYLRLSQGAERILSAHLGSVDRDRLQRFVVEELRDDVRVRRSTTTDKGLFLMGRAWSFGIEQESFAPLLRVSSPRQESPERLDAQHDRLPLAPFAFRFGTPLHYPTAERSIERLFDIVRHHDDEAAARAAQREEQRLFNEWSSQIAAREQVELNRQDPLEFQRARVSGHRFRCRLASVPTKEVVGQERIATFGNTRVGLKGTVEALNDRDLTLLLAHTRSDKVPSEGRLVLDTTPSRIKIDREREALRSVRSGSAPLLRSDLGALLLRPMDIRPAVPIDVQTWVHPDLDDAKKSAVRAALGAPDFYLVEGPPGTGKTAFIAELVAQELRRAPASRILLTSQTHIALDNALERIRKSGVGARMVRLVTASARLVSPEVQDLLLDAQLDLWRQDVRQRSDRFVTEWARAHGIELPLARRALRLNEAAEGTEALVRAGESIAEIQRALDAEGEQPLPTETESSADGGTTDERRAALADDLDTAMMQRDVLQSQINGQLAELDLPRGLSTSELRRVASVLLEPSDAAEQLLALVELQARWRERIASGLGFEEAVLASCQVVAATCTGLSGIKAAREIEFDVCILDEASKATATESLVPFVRAKRWVLVGDEKQLPPFQEEALDEARIQEEFQLDQGELNRTLFSRLLENAPRECQVLLSFQHRMLKPIGDLISICFYGGVLNSAERPGPAGLELALPAPVTWFDTAALRGNYERRVGGASPSYANDVEASEIVAFLQRLAFVITNHRTDWPWESPRVLVLSGYRPQVSAIQQRVDSVMGRLHPLEIEVATVDGAQGREAEFAVFSVTRCNQDGNIGFLERSPRINVALSRGRYGLAIFGNYRFMRNLRGPLKVVTDYVAERDGCVVQQLESGTDA